MLILPCLCINFVDSKVIWCAYLKYDVHIWRISYVCIRDVKFEPTGRAPRRAPGPRRAFAGPNVRLLGLCWAQHEWPNAKGIYCWARCCDQRGMLGLMLCPSKRYAMPVPCRVRILGKIDISNMYVMYVL